MSEWDNTNSGVIFTPHSNQVFSGQGKLNINGTDHKIVLVREPVKRDGEAQLVVYTKIGVLFPNDKASENERAPKFSGPILDDMRLAAWPQEKDGRKYMSLKASVKQSQDGGGRTAADGADDGWGGGAHMDDEIPF